MNQENRQVLYLGNLRCDIAKREILNHILDLFKHYIGIDIKYEDVTVCSHQSKLSSYAFVNVHSEHQAEFALDQLSSWDRRRQLQYNFTLLCESSQPLKAAFKLESPSKHVKKKKKKKKNQTHDETTEKYDEHNFPTPPAVRMKQFTSVPFHGNSAMALYSVSENNISIGQIKNKFPVAGSTRTSRKVYYVGHNLGNETRNVEFKTGGGMYLKNYMRDDVEKYVCGFLNSGESGVLYVGVTDVGKVVGTECDQSTEDFVRRSIDQAITSIQPFLLPNMYSVKFTPVYNDDDTPKENTKVIEISVEKTGETDRLYEVNGKVYVRRDGSVQGPLKPSGIQDWTQQKYTEKMNKMKEENISEMKKLQEKIDKQEEQLKEKMRRSPEYHDNDKKSKVCAIQ